MFQTLAFNIYYNFSNKNKVNFYISLKFYIKKKTIKYFT